MSAKSARGWRASACTRMPGTATFRPRDRVSVHLPPGDSGSTSVNLLAAASGFNPDLLLSLTAFTARRRGEAGRAEAPSRASGDGRAS